MAQSGSTPLHLAASSGREAAITALLAAKADVLAENDVRVGEGRGGGGEGGGVHCNIVVWNCQPEIVQKLNP